MKCLLLLLCLVSFGVSAEVYKCQGADGKVSYQKNPCPVNANAKPLEIKLPSATALQRMQREERIRDIKQTQIRHKQIELEQQTVRLQIEAARVNAINRSTDAKIQMHLDHLQESADRSEAWQNYQKCRDRARAGFHDPKNQCLMP